MLAYDNPREITVDDLLAFVRVLGIPLDEFVLPAAVSDDVGGWGAYMTAVERLERLREAVSDYEDALAKARQMIESHRASGRASSGTASECSTRLIQLAICQPSCRPPPTSWPTSRSVTSGCPGLPFRGIGHDQQATTRPRRRLHGRVRHQRRASLLHQGDRTRRHRKFPSAVSGSGAASSLRRMQPKHSVTSSAQASSRAATSHRRSRRSVSISKSGSAESG